MRPLSDDLRRRILDAVDNREGPRRQLAARFVVNTSTVTRLLKLRSQTGSSEPRPKGGGRPPALDREGLERLRKLVAETPDATLEQLRQGLGTAGSVMAVWRGLKKLGVTRKKKTLHAAERDAPEVQEERAEFRDEVERVDPGRLVFVDETGVTTAMTPAYGRAPKGERVESSAPASWESVTVIAAVGPDGVRAPLAFPGGTTAATFLAYVTCVLVPALRPGDVVIFDNLAAHLSAAVSAAIEGAGARVLLLPPYSPDFTPIEEMFSKFKQSLRRLGARTKEHLYDAIGQALREASIQDIFGWFRQAGACVMQS